MPQLCEKQKKVMLLSHRIEEIMEVEKMNTIALTDIDNGMPTYLSDELGDCSPHMSTAREEVL